MNGEDWVMEDRSIANAAERITNAAERRKTAALQMQRSGAFSELTSTVDRHTVLDLVTHPNNSEMKS